MSPFEICCQVNEAREDNKPSGRNRLNISDWIGHLEFQPWYETTIFPHYIYTVLSIMYNKDFYAIKPNGYID